MNLKKAAKRLTAYTFLLVILAFIGTLAVSYFVGSQLIHPKRKPVVHTPADFHLLYKDISFRSGADTTLLRGWILPADSSAGRIVIEAHGYKGNRSDIHAVLPVAGALHKANIAVLLFDFRASGESEGKTVTVGQNETGDLLGAVNYARSAGYRDIGVIGFSMGASTAIMAVSADSGIEAAVADSPFANLDRYLDANLSIWSGLPRWPFTDEIIWEIRFLDGLNPASVNPDYQLRHWKPRPLMLIAGTGDSEVPYSNSVSLYHIIQKNPSDTLWLVRGAGHVKAYDTAPRKYLKKITAFFVRNLK